MTGVFNDSKKIEEVFVQDIPVAKISLQNRVVYAGYPYPCVGENNLTPITLQQYIELRYVGDPQNFQVSLYFSKYIESFEYRIVLDGTDSGFRVCPLDVQVVPDVYGSVKNRGNYAALLGMCAPRFVANKTSVLTMLTEFKIDGELYSYNYIRK